MKEVFQAFIDKISLKISSDPRLCGLAVAGSWVSNEIDQYSDLDLIVVCNDSDFLEVQKDRLKIVRSFGDFLSAFTGEHVGEPRVLICLFKNPLIHVDIKFVAVSDFHERIEDPWIVWSRNNDLDMALQRSSPHILKPDPQWIEDRFWTWIHYGAVKIGRGELFEAIGFLSFIRERVLAPLALWSHGKPVRGVRRVEIYLPAFSKQLERTVPSYDRQSCLDALKVTVDMYQDLRAQYTNKEIVTNPEAEKEVLKYLSQL